MLSASYFDAPKNFSSYSTFMVLCSNWETAYLTNYVTIWDSQLYLEDFIFIISIKFLKYLVFFIILSCIFIKA